MMKFIAALREFKSGDRGRYSRRARWTMNRWTNESHDAPYLAG